MVAVALLQPRAAKLPSPIVMIFGSGSLLAALVLSYSRASLVNLAVALAALGWLQRHRIPWLRLGRMAAAFVALSALILSAAFPVFTRVYWARIAAAFQYFSESPNMVLSGRLASWQVLGHYLAAHPWIALVGVGYKTLPYSDFIGTTAVGDNTYLTLLVETGIAGLAAVIALNVAILISSYRAARSTDVLCSFAGAWMFCFWAGQSVQMLSADLLTYWRILPVYFFVLALALRRDGHSLS
jgi:O-antigen ligase